MKLRTQLYGIIAMTVAALGFQSCESFTDIDQKGVNQLKKVSDLELLLNFQYDFKYTDCGVISGDVIEGSEAPYFPQLFENAIKNYNTILAMWDEGEHSSRLPMLTSDDGFYESCYNIIGRVANPVLAGLDNASGSEEDKKRLRAEALTLRAYCHFLAAQKYARAYNPVTAETEPCMPYLTDDWDIQVPTSQLTQKEYYEKIIADLDRAIELNSLQEVAKNRMRICAAVPYALKAHVLLTIRDIDGARDAAQNALRHGSEINNYATLINDETSRGGVGIKVLKYGNGLNLTEDYLSDGNQNEHQFITPYCESMFEPGSYRMLYSETYFKVNLGKNDPADLDNDLILQKKDHLQQYGVDYDIFFDSDPKNAAGVKTTHMYLILAECAIEKGNFDEAMGYLDTVRKNRIEPGYYRDLKGTVSSKADAIKCLKKTCHGEYALTIWNFFCRKRWNQLGDYKETLTRQMCGKTFTLTPESDMWVFPLPLTVMAQNPNLKHNYTTAV